MVLGLGWRVYPNHFLPTSNLAKNSVDKFKNSKKLLLFGVGFSYSSI